MKTHKSLILIGIVALVALITLALFTGLTQAQGPGPTADTVLQSVAAAPGAIPIQGRLTNPSGNPLSGTYSIMFRLYEVDMGGTAVCTDTRSVSVVSGLFSDYMDGCYNDITGQKLWLGVKVGSDAEMMPRQVIYPVPYAISLVPGAVISTSGYPALHVESSSTSGRGLRAYASATSGTNFGVVGASSSPNGYGGYFYDDANGIGLYGRGGPGVLGEGYGPAGASGVVGRAGAFGAGVKGEGNMFSYGGWFTSTTQPALRAEGDGAALQLGGSGRIESTADSYIFVPGSALVKEQEDNTLRWAMQANGAVLVYRGATAGNQYIHIPIVLPGVLYGQAVTVKSVTIYYLCANGTNNYITATDLHKQTDADTFAILVSETTNRTSNIAASYTLTPTSNHILSSSQGILMLRLYLNFANDTDFIRIGGVRVQLGH